MGAASGFGGVILHGLSTFGFAARAILQAVGGGDPTALRYFGVRFTAPVKPGDELETRAWEVSKGPDGTAEVAFEVKNVTTDKVRCFAGMGLVVRKFLTTFTRSSSVVVLREWSRRSGLGFEEPRPVVFLRGPPLFYSPVVFRVKWSFLIFELGQ